MNITSLSTWEFANQAIAEMNPVSSEMNQDKAFIRRLLDHKHMIETVERFEWINLPEEIPSDLIERVLYFRFKGALFRVNGRYIFLPFTLKGENAKTIDSYGRYLSIIPVLFTGQWKMAGDGSIDEDIDFLPNKSWDVVYDLPQDEIEAEYIDEETGISETISVGVPDADTKAVILTDSTLEISQDYTPMNYLIRPINEQLTDILVLVNMDLISSAKAFYIVAKDEAQKEAIEQEFAHLDQRILSGKRYVVVTAATDLKELTGSQVKDSARYFQSYQSIDNLRKDFIGVDNGGTFMKQEHTTNMETMKNSNSGSSVLNNALRVRKEFCRIVNKVFGLNIDVESRQGQEQQFVEPQGSQSIDRQGGEE